MLYYQALEDWLKAKHVTRESVPLSSNCLFVFFSSPTCVFFSSGFVASEDSLKLYLKTNNKFSIQLQEAHWPEFIPGFCSMEQMRALLLPPGDGLIFDI